MAFAGLIVRVIEHAGVLMSIGVLLVLLTGCSVIIQATRKHTPQLNYRADLLTGARLPGGVSDEVSVPDVDVGLLDQQMKTYVAHQIGDARLQATRLDRLVSGLRRDGYFRDAVDPQITLTAMEAFQSKGGNCLSYTNLFVALAREAGLDAVYQVVDVSPSWDADAGFLIQYVHINVLLRGLQIEHAYKEVVTVDFNVIQANSRHRRQVVSDDYATSLYYANHAVQLIRQGRLQEAFGWLRRAIELAPYNADLWVNLGALYASMNDAASAIQAYDVAMQIDSRHPAALSGLARSHAVLGDVVLASSLQNSEQNPAMKRAFSDFAQAQAAFADGDYRQSLEFIDRALRLRSRDGRMHNLKGQVEQALGNKAAARRSFDRARRLGVAPSSDTLGRLPMKQAGSSH